RRLSAERRKLEHIDTLRRLPRPQTSALCEECKSRLTENIHAIVARHGIASQSDRDSLSQPFTQRRAAVSKLAVRCGTVRNWRPCFCNRLDVAVANANAVNEQRGIREHSQISQQLNR